MSNYEIDFWWWIHILHFKYVWNLPTLSLAWFFFFHIEFRTMCVRQSEPNQQNLSYNFQLDKENDTGIHTTSLLMNLARMVSALPTQLSQSRQTNQIIWSHTVIIVTLSKERTLAILQLFQPQYIQPDSDSLYRICVSQFFIYWAKY